MKWHKYSHQLKEEITDYQSPVDVDAIWNAIEPKVDAINRKRRNRRGFYWILALGILLSVSGISYLGFMPDKQSATAVMTEAETNFASSDDPAGATQKVRASGTATDALSLGALSTELPAGDQPPATSTSTGTDKNTRARQQKPPYDASSQSPQPSNVPAGPVSDSDELRRNDLPALAATKESQADKKAFETPVTPSKVKEHTERAVLPESELTMLNPLSPPRLAYSREEPSFPDLSSSYIRPYGSNKGLSYSIMFQAGIAATSRKLEADSDSIGAILLQERLNSETPLENIQLALLAGLHHHSGLNLMTGLQFTRITERFENTVTVETRDSMEGIIRIIVNPNGDTTEVIGQVPVTTTTTTRKRYYNRYNLIDVPLILGYQKDFNRLRLGLQAGVFANIALSTRGRIFGQNRELIDIGDRQDDFFKKNVGISYYFSFSVGYELSPGLLLHFSPNLHHYPGRFTADGYPLAQKYSLLGVRAGLQYEF